MKTFYSFRESPAFTKKVIRGMTEDDYFALQNHLLEYPADGNLIPGGHGLRKLRWRAKGRGKRGGFRVIYYLANEQGYIYLLSIYAKNEQTDLSKQQLKDLSELVREWLL